MAWQRKKESVKRNMAINNQMAKSEASKQPSIAKKAKISMRK